MVKLENIYGHRGGFQIVCSGEGTISICREKTTFFSNMYKVNVYREEVNKIEIFWVVGKNREGVNILRICKNDICLLISVKGRNFKENTEITFLYDNRYFKWDLFTLEYIQNNEALANKISTEITCYASSKIDEVGFKIEKQEPPK